jgi:two-component system OmpR family response regulator
VARVCKVLVVEGNDDVRELFTEVLSDEGYRLLTARNGEEMRRLVAAEPGIDVLVIDVAWLGAQDGLALAQEMAAWGHAVLLVTGDHRLVERIEQSGHRYLLKPFRLASLLELIECVLHEVANDCTRASRQA